MKKTLSLMMGAAVMLGVAGKAHGHGVSIGYENAGVGSVNIWLGTYQHGGHHLEGSLNLVGVNGNTFASTTVAFSMLTGNGAAAKPAGLVDGVTNFYSDGAVIGNNNPLVGSEANFLAGCPGCGPVNHWQGVNFTGLGAGEYKFTWIPIANPTAEWSPLALQMEGIFDLTSVVVPPPTGGVPDGGASLALIGLSLLGLAGARRRFKSRA